MIAKYPKRMSKLPKIMSELPKTMSKPPKMITMPKLISKWCQNYLKWCKKNPKIINIKTTNKNVKIAKNEWKGHFGAKDVYRKTKSAVFFRLLWTQNYRGTQEKKYDCQEWHTHKKEK